MECAHGRGVSAALVLLGRFRMSRLLWQWLTSRAKPGSPRHQCKRRVGERPSVELLESRELLSGVPALHPQYVPVAHLTGAWPLSTSAPTGTTPAQIRHAYGV